MPATRASILVAEATPCTGVAAALGVDGSTVRRDAMKLEGEEDPGLRLKRQRGGTPSGGNVEAVVSVEDEGRVPCAEPAMLSWLLHCSCARRSNTHAKASVHGRADQKQARPSEKGWRKWPLKRHSSRSRSHCGMAEGCSRQHRAISTRIDALFEEGGGRSKPPLGRGYILLCPAAMRILRTLALGTATPFCAS